MADKTKPSQTHFWDREAAPKGYFAECFCLLSAVLYIHIYIYIYCIFFVYIHFADRFHPPLDSNPPVIILRYRIL